MNTCGFCFVVVCMNCINDILPEEITIFANTTGIAGRNETQIICEYKGDNLYYYDVMIHAFINDSFEWLVRFDPNDQSYINEEYLGGRVSVTNATKHHRRFSLYFNNLLCIDDRDYRCRMYKQGNRLPYHIYSNITHIHVQVLPAVPSAITIFNANATEEGWGLEGQTITAICAGEVGKPARNLTMRKIRSNGEFYEITPDNSPVNIEMPNCTFFQNNTFTTTLYEGDNGSVLRCAVEGFIDDDAMFVETREIIVLYPVRIPNITAHSDLTIMPPITLHCKGSGNPEPHYTWFKLSANYMMERFEFHASSQNITLYRLSESGLYKCETNNTIGKITYSKSRNVTVILKDATTNAATTTKPSTLKTSSSTHQGFPNTVTSTVKLCKCNYVAAISGGVFGTLGVCIVVSVGVYLCQARSKRNDKKADEMTSIPPDQSLPSNYEGIDRDQTDHPYTEIGQEHPYYNTYAQHS